MLIITSRNPNRTLTHKIIKKDMAKYKNKAGEYLYLFNWTSGGFNDVWAKNKKDAIKQIAKEFPGGKLQVNESTLRRCTYEEYQAQNKMGWMLSM